MHKHLEGDRQATLIQLLADPAEILEGELAGQNNPLATQANANRSLRPRPKTFSARMPFVLLGSLLTHPFVKSPGTRTGSHS